MASSAALEKAVPAGDGSDPVPFSHIWSAMSNSGLLSTREMEWHAGDSPGKGHRDDYGNGATLIREAAKKAGTAQPREERAQGDLISSI